MAVVVRSRNVESKASFAVGTTAKVIELNAVAPGRHVRLIIVDLHRLHGWRGIDDRRIGLNLKA